jgi:ubiquinone/menaquinone biosynthesis C-methylase UbiE
MRIQSRSDGASRRRILARTCAAVAVAASCFGLPGAARAATDASPTIYKNDDLSLIIETQELKRPRIDKVVASLGLKPGMKILDIGAGTGQQSYALAAALKGTGEVDATDIEPRLVDYVNEQARKKNLSNLHAHLVSGDGFDAFYSGRRYDLIVMWEVYNYLADRPDYYRRLRACLNPGGRVVMVEAEQMSQLGRGFFREDFSDWDGFLSALKREPADSPFGAALGKPLRGLFARGLGGDDPLVVRTVLFHVNRLLETRFYKPFSDGVRLKPGLDLTPDERTQAEWMLHRLTLDHVDQREFPRLEYQLVSMMGLLNKLLVVSHFRPYLRFDGRSPYWSSAPEAVWLLRRDGHLRDMEAGGFRLLDESPFVPYQAVWTFAADDGAHADEDAP